jgi:hypothetical protein
MPDTEFAVQQEMLAKQRGKTLEPSPAGQMKSSPTGKRRRHWIYRWAEFAGLTLAIACSD